MLKNEKCANYKPGFVMCELCIIEKQYVNLQNSSCKSCFKSIYGNEK